MMGTCLLYPSFHVKKYWGGKRERWPLTKSAREPLLLLFFLFVIGWWSLVHKRFGCRITKYSKRSDAVCYLFLKTPIENVFFFPGIKRLRIPRGNLNVSLWGGTWIVLFRSHFFLGPLSKKSSMEFAGNSCVEMVFQVPVNLKRRERWLRDPKFNLSLRVARLGGWFFPSS